jgi:hypothetical protein
MRCALTRKAEVGDEMFHLVSGSAIRRLLHLLFGPRDRFATSSCINDE